MSSFREHLEEFQSRGQRCLPCLGPSSGKTEPITVDEMMKKKFKSSWRHSMIAWVTLLALLVLAGTYGENTKWDRAIFVGPTKYNISALLEGGDDDDVGVDVVDGVKTGKADKEVPIVDVEDDGGKEAKAAKEKKVVSEEEPTPPVKEGKTGVDDGADEENEKEKKAGKKKKKKTLNEEENVEGRE